MILLAVAIFLWWSERVSEPVGITLVAFAALFEIVEVWFWIRYLKRFRVRTGREAMVGETAEIVRPCDPKGTAMYRGEIWACRCESGARPGERVVIEDLEGLTLVVNRAEAEGVARDLARSRT